MRNYKLVSVILLCFIIIFTACSTSKATKDENSNIIRNDIKDQEDNHERILNSEEEGEIKENLKTYENEGFRFSVKYPSDWKTVEAETWEGNDQYEGSPDGGITIYVESDETESIYVFGQSGPKGIPMSDSIIREEFATETGIEGFLLKLESDERYMMYLILDDGFYGAILNLSKDCYDRNKNQIINILKSIDILPSRTVEELLMEDNVRLSEELEELKNLIKEMEKNNPSYSQELLKNDEITNLVQNAHNIYTKYFFLERFNYSLSEYESFYIYTNSGEKRTYKYYLVTEEGIGDIKGLKNFLSQYYTYETINDFLKPYNIEETTILYNGRYIEYKGKLYSSEVGGIGILADKKIMWEDAKFELCGVLENETESIYKMILPIAYYDEDYENIENVESFEKFIRLKKDQNGLWKLNDLIKLDIII